MVSLAVGAMPEFLVGTVLIWLFFTKLALLPPVSGIPPGETPFTHATGLILPVLTLLAVSLAYAIRLVRATTAEALQADYVMMARLCGYRERRVVVHYALRNALAPSIQALALTIQYLIGGIIVTESVFDYPGIGSQLVQAVQVRDFQTLAVIATILAAICIAVNILADLCVHLLVPRLMTRP
jgi:peptide/nickel transport system permease protein